MEVLFLGGPFDGMYREVPDTTQVVYVPNRKKYLLEFEYNVYRVCTVEHVIWIGFKGSFSDAILRLYCNYNPKIAKTVHR